MKSPESVVEPLNSHSKNILLFQIIEWKTRAPDLKILLEIKAKLKLFLEYAILRNRTSREQ